MEQNKDCRLLRVLFHKLVQLQHNFPEKITAGFLFRRFWGIQEVIKMYALETINLTKKYKNQHGAEDISMKVEQGEIYGLERKSG